MKIRFQADADLRKAIITALLHTIDFQTSYVFNIITASNFTFLCFD